MPASKNGRQATSLPNCDTYESHQHPAWHDNSKCAVMTVTSSSQVELKTWHWKPRQLLDTREVTIIGEEYAVTYLLNKHNP